MPFTDAAKNYMLDQWGTNKALYYSVHTSAGVPSSGGSGEATGGSPTYARKAATWNAAAGGTKDNSNAPVFDLPAGTYRYIGVWDTLVGGVFQGYAQISDVTLASQGTLNLADLDVDLNAAG